MRNGASNKQITQRGVVKRQMKYNLKELKQMTTRICKLASNARHTFRNAAVNWADLRCTCAEYLTDDDGDTGHRVYIEEASPDNAEVIKFITTELILHGYKDVEVLLQW